MAVNWVTFFGGSTHFEPFQALNETIQGAATNGFYLEDNSGHLLTFYGQFTLDAGGNITGGTIAGFKGYVGNTQTLNAYGYAMDFNAFNAGRTGGGNALAFFDLLLPNGSTVNGSIFGDILFGGLHDDILIGRGGDDEMRGDAGNDLMTGGEGKDTMNGGDGNDFVNYVDRNSPVEVTLNGPEKVIVKVGGVDEDSIIAVENVIGGSANDILIGDGFSNAFAGLGGDDKIKGNDGNDTLTGNDGRDKVNGGKGNDTVGGGAGNDLLKGGKDSDTFLFTDALDGNANVDKIKGFKPGVDKISLYHVVFEALDVGDLSGKQFRVGEKAKDADDRIIYDDGKLFYDADGKGGAKQVEFAVLKKAPDIHADDFMVV